MNSSSDFFSGHSFGDVQVLAEKKSKQPFWHVLALPTVSEKVWCCRVLDARRRRRGASGRCVTVALVFSAGDPVTYAEVKVKPPRTAHTGTAGLQDASHFRCFSLAGCHRDYRLTDSEAAA